MYKTILFFSGCLLVVSPSLSALSGLSGLSVCLSARPLPRVVPRCKSCAERACYLFILCTFIYMISPVCYCCCFFCHFSDEHDTHDSCCTATGPCTSRAAYFSTSSSGRWVVLFLSRLVAVGVINTWYSLEMLPSPITHHTCMTMRLVNCRVTSHHSPQAHTTFPTPARPPLPLGLPPRFGEETLVPSSALARFLFFIVNRAVIAFPFVCFVFVLPSCTAVQVR